MIAEAFDETIHYNKTITGWRPNIDLSFFIQYQKIFLKIGKIDHGGNTGYYGGLMTVGSLSDKSMLQFKGMSVYDKDIYRLKQDEYKNWVLLNTSKLREARDKKYPDSAKVKEKDYIIKLLSPLEALVVNHLLNNLNNTSS